MRTDTHAQRNHKIVVGTVVALIAAAGIGTLAMNAHRLVATRSARTAAPAAAFPDNLAPQASPAPEANPPPVADGPPAASTLKSETAPPATEPAQSTAKPEPQRPASGARASSVEQSSATSGQRGASTAATDGGLKSSVPAGQSAVVTANTKVAADTTSSATAFGNGQLAANEAGSQLPSQAQAKAAGADAANGDRVITSAVQSQIAADSMSQQANLAVNTINGVVILTGTVPNADVVEHVKQVVQQVKDVRGVDTTAVKVAGT